MPDNQLIMVDIEITPDYVATCTEYSTLVSNCCLTPLDTLSAIPWQSHNTFLDEMMVEY